MRNRLTTEDREALQSLPIYQNIGFEFNAGWFELIFDLGQKISDYCHSNNIPLPQMRQIKEKFATLRFYYSDPTSDDQIRKWVRAAEEKSGFICESCGAAGTVLCDGGRWYTACPKHTVKGSLTSDEYKVVQEERSRAMRQCDVCGKKGSDGYYDSSLEIHTNRCPNHVEDYFITDKEYWEEKDKLFDEKGKLNGSTK